jgi:UDP:flavonoid glycosyltransferase YjiC (YdhE family)
VRFIDELVSLEDVAATCDLFVSNGSHTSVVRTLLAGVPQLLVPNYREQLFTARRVAAIGAGLICARDGAGPRSYAEALSALLAGGDCREASQRFAERHADFDAQGAVVDVAARLSGLLG